MKSLLRVADVLTGFAGMMMAPTGLVGIVVAPYFLLRDASLGGRGVGDLVDKHGKAIWGS